MSGYGFTQSGTVYDDEDRLTGFARANSSLTQSWSLTSVGDWNSVTTSGIGFQPVVQNRTHGPTHELLTAGGQTVNTDVKGNITLLPAALSSLASTALGISWDFDNKLKSVDVGNNSSTEVEYKYDALGRRVARVGSSGSYVYVQSDQQTIADYGVGDAPSSPLYRYVYASYIDEPVVRKGAGTGGTIHYFHRNQQYSITAVTTSAGSVVERYAYSAYGEPTFLDSSGSPLASSNLNQRFTYTGREWDATVGLYHFRARWMSPKTGRFLGRDPIRYRGGIGLYANNFAMSRMDPFGLITARGEITVGQGTLLIGWVMPPDPFLNPAIKAIAWMNGSSDDGCRFSSPVIGDYLLPRTQSIDRVGFNFVTGADKQGPNNFLVDANPECCCPDDKVECSHFYIHMVSGLGFGLEVTGGEGAVTVTGGIQVELLDYYFSLVICADGSATVETVFVRDYDHADASYYVGMKHNANGRQTQYKGLVYSGSNWFPDRDKDITIAYYSSKSGSCLKMADGPLVPRQSHVNFRMVQ